MEGHRSRRRVHFVITNTSQTERYQRTKLKIEIPPLPELPDRAAHGQALFNQLSNLKPLAEEARQQQQQAGITAGLGLQIQFSSFPDVELAIKSLEDSRFGIELRNVRRDKHHVYATVFVPDGNLKVFEQKIQAYLEERKRDNKALINTIQEIRVAAFNELWTDDVSVLPATEDEAIWWEVWLSASDDREAIIHGFRNIAGQVGFELSRDVLHFPDRIVLLMHGTQRQIKQSVMLLNSVAELRRAKETAEFFDTLKPTEQREWVDELLERTQWPEENSPYVCILDTGVNAGHPLLAPVLGLADLHAVEPVWGVDDREGHGTEMAGLAVWGDLTEPMADSSPVIVSHRLESVKLLPRNGGNADKHHGNLTLEAVSRPEITAPYRKRVFNLAVTAKDNRDRGRPSAWSGTLDRLACDVSGEGLSPRLIVVSAGNVNDHHAWQNYPNSNATDGIHDPGQAWNALTVGAYTQKVHINGLNTAKFSPIAAEGGLSPLSTTSVTWQKKQWPLKPDVVFEGGNVGKDAIGPVTMPCLDLLTTYHHPTVRLLTTSRATSAATALCSRMAAQLMAQYPSLWPETIRALIVHSAEWTPQMRQDFLPSRRKADYENLIRHCGFGVPNLERALWSAANSLTLIVQNQLQPFMREGRGEPKMRDMHLHTLPWPKDALESLGEIPVELRVTLSYFIESSPGIVERGGGGRYRYESHGLRFEVRRPDEPIDQFRKRINQRVRDEEEGAYSGGGSDPAWRLGTNLRHLGSLHSDTWTGTAAALASCNILAVYPVTGWWKTRKKQERYDRTARYALVVSIRTPETDVDLYSIVENLVGVAVSV